jgi:hypothetical protein
MSYGLEAATLPVSDPEDSFRPLWEIASRGV